MTPFGLLFRPFNIGSSTLKNRVVMTPFALGYGNPDGTVSPLILEHYREMAQGGAALIIVEHTLVDEKGMASDFQIRADNDRFLPGLRDLAKVIRENGALAGIQISHAGRYAARQERLSASAVPIQQSPGVAVTPRAMTRAEIDSTIKSYRDAAGRVKSAGFDVVELHGAVGYLLSSFISPHMNRRDDEYGGTLENRMRFPLAVVNSVKEAVGKDFPVGYRFMADEQLANGFKPDEAKVFAKRLEEAGVAYLSVVGGTHEDRWMPEIMEMRQKEGHMVYLAEAIKKEVSLPVITAGRISRPTLAEKILAEGKADLIGLARVLLADPEWPRKAMEGREADIVTCIPGCNTCSRQHICARWDNNKKARFKERLQRSS